MDILLCDWDTKPVHHIRGMSLPSTTPGVTRGAGSSNAPRLPGGSGHHPRSPVHLLAVMDHTTGAVLAQADVQATTNEIARFRPLLHRLDLADTVVTADALSRYRHNASYAEVVVMPR